MNKMSSIHKRKGASRSSYNNSNNNNYNNNSNDNNSNHNSFGNATNNSGGGGALKNSNWTANNNKTINELEGGGNITYKNYNRDLLDKQKNVSATSPSPSSSSSSISIHRQFSYIPANDTELMQEAFIFMFNIIAAAMQFLHIYGTVWWLPESFRDSAINFNLMDRFLVYFILILLSRRFIYCLIMSLINLSCPRIALEGTKIIAGYVYFEGVIFALIFCCCVLVVKQTFAHVAYLLYPSVVYFLIYRQNTIPFLHTTYQIPQTRYGIDGLPLHNCYANGMRMRLEMNGVKEDFINRMKQICFTSLINAYYGGCIQMLFSQSFIIYDTYYCFQHAFVLFVCNMTTLATFCLSPQYNEMVHRSIIHLCKWTVTPTRIISQDNHQSSTIDNKNNNNNNNNKVKGKQSMDVNDSASTTYCSDDDKLFLTSDVVNYNFTNYLTITQLFYCFIDPSRIYFILLIVQLALTIFQFINLWNATEWQYDLSISFLILSNYYILYKIVRNYFITKAMYRKMPIITDEDKFDNNGHQLSTASTSSSPSSSSLLLPPLSTIGRIDNFGSDGKNGIVGGDNG